MFPLVQYLIGTAMLLLIKRVVSGIISLFFIHNIAFATNIAFKFKVFFTGTI
jgi:hypothetical protein